MADDRTMLERSQSYSELLHGKRATSQEMVDEFAKYDLNRRADTLHVMDGELKSDAPLTLNEARALIEDRQRRKALGRVHEALRKAGR